MGRAGRIDLDQGRSRYHFAPLSTPCTCLAGARRTTTTAIPFTTPRLLLRPHHPEGLRRDGQGAVYGDAFARAHHGTQLPPTQQDAGRGGRTRLRLEERFCWVLPDRGWISEEVVVVCSFPPLGPSWAHSFSQRCDFCRRRPSPPTGIEFARPTLRRSAFTPARQPTPTGTPPLPSARYPLPLRLLLPRQSPSYTRHSPPTPTGTSTASSSSLVSIFFSEFH
jgi:hypothetical protein